MRSSVILGGIFVLAVKAQNLFNLPNINPSLVTACFQSGSTSPCQDAQSALYKCYSSLDPNNLNATKSCFCAGGASNYLSSSAGCLDCLLKASNNSNEAPTLSQYSTDISSFCSATLPTNAASFISQYVTDFGVVASDFVTSVISSIEGSAASSTISGSTTTATASSSSSTLASGSSPTVKTATATSSSLSSSPSPSSGASRRGVDLGIGALGAVAGAVVALI